MLDNKLGISNPQELRIKEETISKKKAVELFDSGILNNLQPGVFSTLQTIHRYLFEDIYDFAGEIRDVNLMKGYFAFAPAMYLESILKSIDNMPQSSFDEIIEKYVEMNIAHPFREGNGRSMRIWLDHLLKAQIGFVVDWALVGKTEYFHAIELSPICDTEIKALLKTALTRSTDDRDIYLKGIDRSYLFEGFESMRAADM